MKRKKIALLVIIALIGFLTNLIWENVQAPLYKGFVSFGQHFKQCLIASVGDMVFVVVVYLIFVGVFRDWYWIQNLTLKLAILVVLLGGISAVVFEKVAFHLGYWSYGKMPVIPLLDVGLMPVIQLMVLPILSYYLGFIIFKKYIK